MKPDQARLENLTRKTFCYRDRGGRQWWYLYHMFQPTWLSILKLKDMCSCINAVWVRNPTKQCTVEQNWNPISLNFRNPISRGIRCCWSYHGRDGMETIYRQSWSRGIFWFCCARLWEHWSEDRLCTIPKLQLWLEATEQIWSSYVINL